MGIVHRKVPIAVTATFMPDGSVLPRGITYDDSNFVIDKVISKARRTPRGVGAIAPVEYRVMIRGHEKKIYYESETNNWFSVKEILT